MEFGLCCLFHKEDIKFKTYTYAKVSTMSKEDAKIKISEVWNNNIDSLQKALNYCFDNDIKSYRVSSDMFPQFDRILDLNIFSTKEINSFKEKLECIKNPGIILSMHPGQHVNMGSPNDCVIENSLQDLRNHFFIAKLINCTEINIHIGGSYGNKEETKLRFIKNMKERLTKEELSWITIENDELNYSIKDVVEVANILGIRVTYDIHHQRCHELKYKPDGRDKEYFQWARETWNGYGYQRMHISTPKDGYTTISKSRPHHDYIDRNDLPDWLLLFDDLHLDIEAKHKEQAIFKLRSEI